MPTHTFDPNDVTILMVDDNPANVKLLADMMISRGYKVQQASNGPDALKIAQQDPPNLVLLDIFMPDMDGYEVCHHLKVDPRTCDIPVIFISALTDVEDIVKGFDVGGSDYITKPFKFKEVLARIANLLTLVHQRHQIETLREQDRQHFETLDRMKTEFIRMATHDLRNPLNVILGYVRVLERIELSGRDRELLTEARQNIELSVQKMRNLVTDVLDLAQIETGMDFHREMTPLGPFLAASLQGFHTVADEKGVELIFLPPAIGVSLMIDVKRMTRVMENLVSNAIKYTPPGGQVTVSARHNGEQALITVSDTGFGIPENDLPYLFDAFYRIEQGEYQREEGSGLGLSIVKTIVEQHKGTISVMSRVSRGSTFLVALPLEQAAS